MTVLSKAAARLVMAGAAAIVSVSVAWADFEAGNEAYAKRNYDAAFKAWLPLAEAGDPLAQNNIGFMYRKGRGVALDEAQAIEWYSRAAAQGLPAAMTNLGYMYDEGRTVEQDFVESYKWFLLAHERGREGAEDHLKFLEEEYMTPEQVEQAKALAADWQPKLETPAE
jgi:TPR repeat protein